MKSFLLIVAVLCALAASAVAQTKFELDGNRLKLPTSIEFTDDSDKFTRASETALKHVKEFLEAKKYVTALRVEAHLADSGDAAKTQQLSEKQALAAAKWLIANGVDCKRLIAVGFGATKPIATPKDSTENRRVEFYVASLNNRAVGGQPLDGGGKSAGELCPAQK